MPLPRVSEQNTTAAAQPRAAVAEAVQNSEAAAVLPLPLLRGHGDPFLRAHMRLGLQAPGVRHPVRNHQQGKEDEKYVDNLRQFHMRFDAAPAILVHFIN